MIRHIDKYFVKDTIKQVLGLGITMTIGYGTLFYSFTIMSLEFEKSFGWSKSFIYGVFSLGLLLGAILAPYVGKKLDKYGARTIMATGSLLVGVGLFFAAFIDSKLDYIFTILYLEIAATLVLYEAAFVAFSQIAKEKARLPMAQITLISGFASTIFWPLIYWLLSFLSWNEVYIVLSLFNILISLPIHLYVLNNKAILANSNSTDEVCQINNLDSNKHIVLILLIVAFSFIAIPITVIQTHFISILTLLKIEHVVAISLGLLVGPFQVGARVVEMYFSKHITALHTGLISSLFIFTGLLMGFLVANHLSFAVLFVIFYSIGQGLNYISRGALPLYIFGYTGYGQLTGKINLFVKVATAMAPLLFAYLIEKFGIDTGIFILVILSFISTISLISLKKRLFNV